jgi:sterol desaturase/sphingolipid hydroxylase (fatty acid hydroxylase superfamily)
LLIGLIGVEYLAARRQRQRVFAGVDTIADLGCAVLSQIAGLAVTAVTIGAYHLTAQWLARQGWSLTLPWSAGAWWSWLAVFLLVDLGQYLTHRLSHRVSILWACHEVHHSSGELNYAVAVRNSSLHGLLIWVFFLPGALLGIPWGMVAACYGINVLYQFLLHTRTVGRLGPLEWWFNTPSHHRVHHGREPKYLDRNFGGVLIVWDRLFGTFQEEEEEPNYGPPLERWNPVWVNAHGFARIARGWREATNWAARWRCLFGPPEAIPDLRHSPRRRPPATTLAWAAIQLVIAMVATLAVVLAPAVPAGWRVAVAVATVVTIATTGALLDGHRWALPLE